MLKPFVRVGMTVVEPGPGMGFFTLELARLVGPEGRVIAVDVQPQMIAGLRRQAERAGLIDRIETRLASAVTMGSSLMKARLISSSRSRSCMRCLPPRSSSPRRRGP